MSRSILFAPGAGASSSSEWMKAWASRLATLGQVTAFDYPYQQERKRRPDPQPQLIAAHLDAIAKARPASDAPLVLAGKSMGSRIGCHASLQTKVSALVCFGYPLRSQAGALRDKVLLELETPVLFIQGTRDPLCPLDIFESVRTKMKAKNELFVVDGGDHSLAVLKKLGPQEAVDARILDVVRTFLAPY